MVKSKLTPQQELVSDGVFTIEEAAEKMGCSRRTVEKMLKARKLPWTRPNGHRMIPRLAVFDHLAANLVEAIS